MRQLAVALFLLVAAPQATPWHTYKAPDGSFSIDFPFTAPTQIDRPTSTMWSTFNGRDQFTVQVFRDPKYAAANAAEALRDYPNPAAAGIEGKVTFASMMHLGAVTGRAVRIDGVFLPNRVPVIQIARAFVTDGRLYLLTVNTTGGGRPVTPLSKRFFSSFQILKSR